MSTESKGTNPAVPQSNTGRLIAVDAARGIAVLGMIVAQVGVSGQLRWEDRASWLALAYGRSSVLLAMLAGLSLALISGRTRPMLGQAMVAVRLRIVMRAFLLFVLGGLLVALGTGIQVILQAYSVLFVCCLPFLGWSPRRLLKLAACCALIAPVLNIWLAGMMLKDCDWAAVHCGGGHFAEWMVTGTYPATIWITFALTGLALGRSDLANRVVQIRMMVAGAVMALAGYGSAWLIVSALHLEDLDFRWIRLASAEPHVGSSFEVAGSLGLAIAVLGVLLFMVDPWGGVLRPIAAVGMVPLTVYSAHIVAIRLIGSNDEASGNGLLVTFLLVTVVFSAIWVFVFGRGPLERLVTWISNRAAMSPDSPPSLRGAPGPNS
ncbi:DUF418 domain-containing protein [Nocardia sp. NPDC004722]